MKFSALRRYVWHPLALRLALFLLVPSFIFAFFIHSSITVVKGKNRRLWDNPCGEGRFLLRRPNAHALNLIEHLGNNKLFPNGFVEVLKLLSTVYCIVFNSNSVKTSYHTPISAAIVVYYCEITSQQPIRFAEIHGLSQSLRFFQTKIAGSVYEIGSFQALTSTPK